MANRVRWCSHDGVETRLAPATALTRLGGIARSPGTAHPDHPATSRAGAGRRQRGPTGPVDARAPGCDIPPRDGEGRRWRPRRTQRGPALAVAGEDSTPAPGRIVPRNRSRAREGVELRRVDLTTADQHRDDVLTPLHTVIDCARSLPLDEALSMADSALRSGRVRRSSRRPGRSLSTSRACTSCRRRTSTASGTATSSTTTCASWSSASRGSSTPHPRRSGTTFGATPA